MFSRREAAGLLLLALWLLAGRAIRTRMLVGSGGAWRDPLWLEEVLPPPPAPATRRPPRPVLGAPVDPNTCSADSLTLLPGVGPVIAQRIVAVRERGVHFARPADLQRVRGIGPVLSAKLAPHLIFAALPDSGISHRNATRPAAAESAKSLSSCNSARR